MDAVVEILKGLDYSPLYVSLKTGIVATIFSFFLGLFAARRVIKAGPKVKAIADGILTLPMVLPPTAAGFFLLLLFSRRRPFGILLYEQFGIKVVQTWAGCIIAATVIAFPLMYRNARAAFEQIDVNLIHAARTLGMPEYKIFWKVAVPSAGPGLVAGTILTLARALGEGTGRVWCDLHACGQYSGKDGNHFPEDRNGYPGRQLSDGGHLGCDHYAGCIRADRPYESGDRSEYEEYPEMVGGTTDGDGSKDT